ALSGARFRPELRKRRRPDGAFRAARIRYAILSAGRLLPARRALAEIRDPVRRTRFPGVLRGRDGVAATPPRGAIRARGFRAGAVLPVAALAVGAYRLCAVLPRGIRGDGCAHGALRLERAGEPGARSRAVRRAFG